MVRWYLCRILEYVYPDRTIRKPTVGRLVAQIITEVDEFGDSHNITTRVLKYPGMRFSAAYEEGVETPDFCLVRTEDVLDAQGVVKVSGELQAEDFDMELSTAADWTWLASEHPTLAGRFADQPTA